ncbi:hypothetical protein MED222_13235 [Vibrio sp. MED222]|nr:hypothetical protein MED222_13235 [Vibrio sp. MED222]
MATVVPEFMQGGWRIEVKGPTQYETCLSS